MSGIHAVIIAGGQGQRLGGVRKADLRIGGVRLIERVIERLGQAERPLLVATGPKRRNLILPKECEAVSDVPGSGGGPMAGLVAAVLALRSKGIASGILVSVAVDTPFLPDDYLSRLVEGLEGGPVAFGAWGEAFYPPNTAWQLDAIANLPEHSGGVESLKALQRQLGGRRVGWDELAENPFDNINALPDLLAMGKRARRQRPL